MSSELGDATLVIPRDNLVAGDESVEKALSQTCADLGGLRTVTESLEKSLCKIFQHLRQEPVVEILQRAYSRIIEDFENNDTDELLSALHHIDAAMRIFGVLPSFDSSCKLRTLQDENS